MSRKEQRRRSCSGAIQVGGSIASDSLWRLYRLTRPTPAPAVWVLPVGGVVLRGVGIVVGIA